MIGFLLIMIPHFVLLFMFGFGVNGTVPSWVNIFFGIALIVYCVG
jgi:hypothetical protein